MNKIISSDPHHGISRHHWWKIRIFGITKEWNMGYRNLLESHLQLGSSPHSCDLHPWPQSPRPRAPRHWSKRCPKVKCRRELGSVTSERLWLKHSPKVKPQDAWLVGNGTGTKGRPFGWKWCKKNTPDNDIYIMLYYKNIILYIYTYWFIFIYVLLWSDWPATNNWQRSCSIVTVLNTSKRNKSSAGLLPDHTKCQRE